VQLNQALRAAIDKLSSAGVGSPRLNAETLLMFILSRDRAYLYAHPEFELSERDLFRYERVLAERATGVPAQYITGHQEFWGMDFAVSPAVLVPRPETEHVIETVLRLAKDRGMESVLRVVDVGTGSGCIALALARELPRAQIDATEVSSPALEIARANAARLQLDGRVNFHQADLLNDLPEGAFDIVVSNPPYVGESEEDQVQLEVRKFEPRLAVFAGPRGVEVIGRLIPAAHAALKPGGWLIMEISGTIVELVKALLTGWARVTVSNDLQGIPRVVAAQKILRE
jgi:release factor glutamine methyltransferase